MNFLLDAMQHLGIYYTPPHLLRLATGDGKTNTPEAYIVANPPFISATTTPTKQSRRPPARR